MKKTPPPVAVSKIDKKLEQYTHALEVKFLLRFLFYFVNTINESLNAGWTSTNRRPSSSQVLVTFSNPQKRSGSFTEGKNSTSADREEAYGGK